MSNLPWESPTASVYAGGVLGFARSTPSLMKSGHNHLAGAFASAMERRRTQLGETRACVYMAGAKVHQRVRSRHPYSTNRSGRHHKVCA